MAIEATFKKVEEEILSGKYVFGVARYEMGFVLQTYFDSISKDLPKECILCEFFVFSHKENVSYTNPTLLELDESKVTRCSPNETKSEYTESLRLVKDYLEEGESYELNYTFDADVEAKGDPFLLYQKLKRKQRTKCSTFSYVEDEFILSFSPEKFWEIDGNQIKTYPMKGTAKRKPIYADDLENGMVLTASEKERAENVMITDLFRNDLGKICEIGSVVVPSLFLTEPFESVWQMTSEIEGSLLKDIDLFSLFVTLFPSGSVTGAPKIRSMELLHALEKRNRGIYTGSLFTLHRDGPRLVSQANVAIRTLVLQKRNAHWKGTYSVGSGVTVLSNSEREYEECLSKLTFLTSIDIPDFELLETIRFFNGRYRFLKYHLLRMRDSSQRLGFPFSEDKAMEALKSISHVASGLLRIRLLLNRKGDFRAESYDFTRTNKKRTVKLSFGHVTIPSEDLFLYHKTTSRDFYTSELELASKEGSEDVILIDELGNVSETCLRNIFYRIGGKWFTPSLQKGGLPGTLRQKLIDKKWVAIQDLKKNELRNAEQILTGNSLRGLERVSLDPL